MQRDLPAGEAVHLGRDATHCYPAHRKLAQQGGEAELVGAAFPIGLDDEQPVTLARACQQLGPWRGGQRLARQ
ncbi:hypothetical protein D3C72_1490230 [compost metagenome]